MDTPDATTEDRMILSRGRFAKQVIRVKSQPSNGLVIGDAGRRKIVRGLKTTGRRPGRGVRILFHKAARRQFVVNLLLGPRREKTVGCLGKWRRLWLIAGWCYSQLARARSSLRG